MPLRLFKVLTGGKPADAPLPDDAPASPREPSTITDKTLGDFIRMVRQTGIQKLRKPD